MRDASRLSWLTAVMVILGLVLAGCCAAPSEKYERIEAIVEGQGPQQGLQINATIVIYEYSTDDDQLILLDAFTDGGQAGLFHALGKMKTRGHLALSGTHGFDLKHIKEIESPEGRKLRLVTDRPIQFGDAWTEPRPEGYTRSACEITLDQDPKKSTGTLLPAMQLKVEPKTDELGLEILKNSWKLRDIRFFPVVAK